MNHDLLAAVLHGHAERVRQLLDDHPELVGTRDERGRTPLHYAFAYRRADVIELLRDRGADDSVRDHRKLRPADLSSLPLDDDLLWEVAVERAGAEHSWPYPQVGHAHRTRWARLGLAALVFLAIAAAVVFAVPGLTRASNTIHAVIDPRPWRADRGEAWTAMAASNELIAVCRSGGRLELVGKRSQVARAVDLPARALDVTTSPSPDRFLALLADGSIHEVWCRSGGTTSAVKVPAPTQRAWPDAGVQRSPSDVLATALDSLGWLVVLRGAGVARYGFDGRTKDGPIRTRSWQTSDLGPADVQQAVITTRSVWIALAGGGVRCIARDDLRAIAGRTAATPPLRSLDAVATDAWAAALDVTGGAWLFDAQRGSWDGPFFGAPLRDLPPLASLGQVRYAFLHEGVAYLTSDDALHAYLFDRRLLTPLVAGKGWTSLHSLPTANDSTILGGASSGLWRVQVSAAHRSAQTTQWDARPIQRVDVDPEGRLACYMAQAQNGIETVQLTAPASTATRWTVVPDSRWKTCDLQLLDVRRLDGTLVFATADGAFVYDVATRAYRDASGKAGSTGDARVQRCQALAADGPALFALADGRPLRWTGASQGPSWTELDVDATVRLDSLVALGGRPIGVDVQGGVHAYSPGQVVRSCTGLVSARAAPPGNRMQGDLLLEKANDWSMSFVHGDAVHTYRSRQGHLVTESLAKDLLPSSGLRQVRRLREGVFALDAGGAIRSLDGVPVFAAAPLPFDPCAAVALAPGPDGVLIASGTGEVVEYVWARGAARSVGNEPLRLQPGQRIASLATTQTAVFAGLSPTGVAACEEGKWQVWPRARSMSSGDGKSVWFLRDGDSVRATLSQGRLDETVFGRVTGLQRFLESAVFAWQAGAGVLVLFDGRGRAGVYRQQNENFAEQALPECTAASVFLPLPDALLVLAREQASAGTALRTVRLDGERLVTATVCTVPAGAGPVSLRRLGPGLRMTYVHDTVLVVREWADASRLAQHREATRGGPAAPFDLDDVVLARPHDHATVLVGGNGGIAAYDPRRGRFTNLRRGRGDTPSHWAETQDGFLLLLRHAGRTRGVTVTGTKVSESELGFDLERAFVTWLRGTQWVAALAGRLGTLGDPVSVVAGALRRCVQALVPLTDHTANAGELTIDRRRGTTTFRWRDEALSPAGTRFLQDHFLGAALAEDGQILTSHATGDGVRATELHDDVLHCRARVAAFAGELDGMRSDPQGGVRARDRDGRLFSIAPASGRLEVRPVASHDGRLLTQLDVGAMRLLFERQADDSLRVRWANAPAGTPVFGAARGGLAFHDVSALVCSADGTLLQATPIGLVVRDAATHAVRRVEIGVRADEFWLVHGRDRIVARSEGRPVLAWHDGKTHGSVDLDTRSEVRDGSPWTWSIDLAAPERGLTVAWQGRARTVIGSDRGSRFADDVIEWIERTPDGSSTWLRTTDGAWRFDPRRGRHAGEPLPSPVSVLRATNHALTVRWDHGTLGLTPFDGAEQSAFYRTVNQDWKLFHDAGRSAVAWANDLWTVVPGRCVVQRTGAALPAVSACHRLPAGCHADSAYLLRVVAGAMILAETPARGQPRLWSFDPAAGALPWRDLGHPVEEALAEMAPVTFVRPDVTKDHVVVRALVHTPDAPIPHRIDLARFWERDRFAWDSVQDVATTGGRTLLLTPVGLLVGNERPSPDDLAAAMSGPVAGPTLGPLRDANGARRATAVLDPERRVQLLVDWREGALRLTSTPSESLRVRRPRVHLGSERKADPVGLRQSWPEDPGPAFGVDLPWMPAPETWLVEGQFRFDRATAATRDPAGGWTLYSSDQGGAFVHGNQIAETEGRRGLRMLAGRTAPLGVVMVRARGSGQAILLLQGDGKWSARGGRMSSPADWEPLALRDVEADFRSGWRVHLDVSRQRWTAHDRYPWDDHAALVVAPAAYPLFAPSGSGVALRFDLWCSLSHAMQPSERPLAIATQGGLLQLAAASAEATATAVVIDPHAGGSVIERTRHDRGGSVCVQTTGALYRHATDAWERIPNWPWQRLDVRRSTVAVDGGGLVVGSRRLAQSDDAWLPHRRAIRAPCDAHYDPEREELWVCTQDEGVFVARLPCLLQ